MSEQFARIIAAWLECFPERSSWRLNKHVCQGAKSIVFFFNAVLPTPIGKKGIFLYSAVSRPLNRLKRSKGLDTALHKSNLKKYTFYLTI